MPGECFSHKKVAFVLSSPVDDAKELLIDFDCILDDGDNSQDISNEIIKTIQHLLNEIEEFTDDELIELVNNTNPFSYEETEKLCQTYNEKIRILKHKWRSSGRFPAYFDQRASGPFLRHILRQCYERAVDNPSTLNSYPPFSSAVYGETSFELVETLLEAVSMKEDDIFIDLGSGVGQVVLQVSASSKVKMCRGIENADYPALCASRMTVEFENLMTFYGKPYQPFQLEKSDFLLKENREKILQSSIVFVNNYAFNPEVEHHLMECFKQLNQDSKIISSKAYRPRNFRITDRNLCDLASILRAVELPPQKVSWTATKLSYTVHTVDRSLLEEYFSNAKQRNGRTMDNQEGHRAGDHAPKLGRSASANDVVKTKKKVPSCNRKKVDPRSECVTPVARLKRGADLLFRSPINATQRPTTPIGKFISGSRNLDRRTKRKNRLRSKTSMKHSRLQTQSTVSTLSELTNFLNASIPTPDQDGCADDTFPEDLSNFLSPKEDENTSNQNRVRRSALTLAQAALQSSHRRRSPLPGHHKYQSSFSIDELGTPSASESLTDMNDSSSTQPMCSTPRPLRRSRQDYGSISGSSTPSTVTKKGTPAGSEPRNPRPKTTKMSNSTSMVRDYPQHHNESDYIQRHNLSLLCEDMCRGLEYCPDQDNYPSHSSEPQHEFIAHNIYGLENIRNELTQHQSTHPGYLHERKCIPLAIRQFLSLYQQQLMNWYRDTQQLALIPASPETAAPTNPESMLVAELRKQLCEELHRRNELQVLLKEKANEVTALSNQTCERLSEVLEKLSIRDVHSTSDLVRQAKVILHQNQELTERVRLAHAEVRLEKANHRRLRERLKQIKEPQVLHRLRCKLSQKGEGNAFSESVPSSVSVSLSRPEYSMTLPIKKAYTRVHPFIPISTPSSVPVHVQTKSTSDIAATPQFIPPVVTSNQQSAPFIVPKRLLITSPLS